METTVRCVGFGRDVVDSVLDSAAGAATDRVEVVDLADFSHGEIDWRGRLAESYTHLTLPTNYSV